ncbi:hypothetical protein [Streptomyces sp. NPDC006274]|uniref:hypothetical protein n=1 Tax=unclassified Streptomyces TaxID=2593676 RepID=UPI0033B11D92
MSVLTSGGWLPAPSPSWAAAVAPALFSHQGTLYAAFPRADDCAVVWSVLDDGRWQDPVPLHEQALTGLRPALVSTDAGLWCLYAEARTGIVHACLLGEHPHGAARNPTALPHQMTTAAPGAVAVGPRRIRTSQRRSGELAAIGEWRLPRRPVRQWSLKDQGWFADAGGEGAVVLAQHDGATWAVHACADGSISGLSWSSEWFGPGWTIDGPCTGHDPAIASHEGQLWLAYRDRGTGVLLACSSPDGHRWSAGTPVTPNLIGPAAPCLTPHAGRLYAAYLVAARQPGGAGSP